MAGEKALDVIVPLVIAKTDGGDRYLYQGAPVPEDLSKDEVKRLLDGGFIGETADASASDDSHDEPSEKWSNDKLTAYAEEHSIDLGEAKTKRELLAAIEAAGPAAAPAAQ